MLTSYYIILISVDDVDIVKPNESHWSPEVAPSDETRHCVAVNQKAQWIPVSCQAKINVICNKGMSG